MNAYYRLYLNSVIKLYSTLVIKSSYEADAINTKLKALGLYAVDPDDPYSWKYYLNLAGQYHPIDTMMQVVSLDTGETIDFTTANLAIHRATAREYVYGTQYYRNLTAKYPDQVMLIKGIINPISIDKALSASDHNILSYDSTLVEVNEQQLIPQLQDYIDNFFVRCYNPDYRLFEPYYYPAIEGLMYSRLIPAIMNIRKAACKTDQAHSFHIRQYLMSFSAIGHEFDYMSLKQKLYFYRNIRYLNLNLGRQEILDEVTQKTLTDRGFSLAKYTMVHNTEFLIQNMDPEVRLNRTTVNGINPAQGVDSKTIGQMLDLEAGVARDNVDVREYMLERDTPRLTNSKSGSLPTKVLESNVVDRKGADPFTVMEVLLNHWIYLSHYDRYKTLISFTNPANGVEYKLSAKNAFIFYLYAYNRAHGVHLKHIPIIGANRVRRIPLPTMAELRYMAPVKKVPQYYLDKIMDDQVPIVTYISTEAFRDVCQQIHDVMVAHREMRHYNGDYVAEGYLHQIIDRCYMDIRIDLLGGGQQDYDAWIADQNIDITSMGSLEYMTIAKDILKIATGGDLGNQITMRETHAAMIRIMQDLSSYSVQFIAQINDDPVKIVDGKFPKLTVPVEDYKTVIPMDVPAPIILEMPAREKGTIEVPVPTVVLDVSLKSESVKQEVPCSVNVELIGTGSHVASMELFMPVAQIVEKPVIDLSDIPVYIGGYEPMVTSALSDLITGNTLTGYETLTDLRRRRLLGL